LLVAYVVILMMHGVTNVKCILFIYSYLKSRQMD